MSGALPELTNASNALKAYSDALQHEVEARRKAVAALQSELAQQVRQTDTTGT